MYRAVLRSSGPLFFPRVQSTSSSTQKNTSNVSQLQKVFEGRPFVWVSLEWKTAVYNFNETNEIQTESIQISVLFSSLLCCLRHTESRGRRVVYSVPKAWRRLSWVSIFSSSVTLLPNANRKKLFTRQTYLDFYPQTFLIMTPQLHRFTHKLNTRVDGLSWRTKDSALRGL